MRFSIALVLALAACKQAKEPTPAGDLLAKVRDLSAKACACTDRACIEPLMREWNSLTTGIGETGKVSGGTFTEEQVEGLATEDERFMKCADKFASPTSPASGSATAPASGSATAPASRSGSAMGSSN